MIKRILLALGIIGMSSPALAGVYSSVCIGNEWVGSPITYQVRYGEVGAFTTYSLSPGQWQHLQVWLDNPQAEQYFYVRYDENRGYGTNIVTEALESAISVLPSNCDNTFAYEFKYDAVQSNFISLYEVF